MIAAMFDRRGKLIVFGTAMAVYLVVGYWLQVRHGFILGDSLSRVSAAQTVVYSRDPHLAAIGFIFTPLTAMVQIPAVLLSPLWPALATHGYAGTLMSAPFMAGAVVQIMTTGTDRGLPRGYVLAITAVFALNPMIVFYGANGMSEAPFVFFVCWAVRRLMMWMVDDDVHHLISAGGIAMAMSYLTRYDAVACIAVAGFIVFFTTYRRAPGEPRFRRALLDMLIVAGPGFATFLAWGAASWLITGEAFAQFTSQYGNAAILQQTGGGQTGGFAAGASFAAVCTLLLAPALLPIGGWAAFQRWRRPNWPVLVVPIGIYSAILAFQAYSYASGSTFGFLRFYITAIPFAATLAMLAVPEGQLVPAKRPGRYAPAPASTPTTRQSRLGYAAIPLALALGLPMAAWGMSLPRYAPQEYALGAVFAPDRDSVDPVKTAQHKIAATFSTERQFAQYLDSLDLPESSVIADTVYGFAVVAASAKPKTFVVPSDPDFVELLNDPAGNGIKYLLVVPPTGRGVSDALNLRYPTLYETGSDVATLELEVPNDGDSQPVWRLYRVNEPVPLG